MAITFAPRPMAHVLPDNASNYIRSLAKVGTDRMLAIEADRIRHLWNPWKCDADDLPYLAWALSVDVWVSSWPDTKKRSVIANAIRHHQLKGTLAGIKAYLDLLDVSIEKVVTPTTKMFSGPTLTKDKREAWLEKLPQIRIYNTYSRGDAGRRLFTGGSLRSAFRERRFPQPSGALERLKHRCAYVVKETVTDTPVRQIDTNIFQIYVNTSDHGAIFSGQRPAAKRYYQPSSAQSRILTVAPVSVMPWRTPVGPTLTPVTSQPELVMKRHNAGPGVFTGSGPKRRRFLAPSRARFYYYQRFAIFDGTGPAKRPSIQFTGVGRYGYPAHKAELTLRLRQPLEERQARFGQPTAAKRFYFPHNPKPMQAAGQAIVSAKRLSDQIVVKTDTTRGIIAGLPFFAGDEYFA